MEEHAPCSASVVLTVAGYAGAFEGVDPGVEVGAVLAIHVCDSGERPKKGV